MNRSEIEQRFLDEVTASRYPAIEAEAPPMRIDITGVGEEPAVPEEVKPELVAPVVAPDSPSMTAYDPTVRERLAEFLQAGFESFGMDRFQARRQAQSLVGGQSSNLPLQLGVADIVPFLGTALQTEEAGRMLEDAATLAGQGDYGGAALNAALGAVGLVPGAIGTVQTAKQVGKLANVAGDKAVQAITGNPQATAMGALEAAGQMSPVSRIAPGVEAQAVQPIKDDSRLLMPAFLDKTKQMESGFIKLNSPIKMKDGSTLSGFESADQKVFYGRDKNGVAFNVPREYVNPDDFVSSRDGNKTMEKIKTNLVESRSPGLTLDVAPSVRTKNFKNWFGDSKVVDSKGKPLVMYHGTVEDNIRAFERNQLGLIFVTPSKKFANQFSMRGMGETPLKNIEAMEEDGLAPNVIPLYVSAKNPFDFENKDHVDAVIKALEKVDDQGGNVPAAAMNAKKLSSGDWVFLEDESVVLGVKRAGFDAMYVLEDGIKNIAVFDPSQLKSAVGNVGTFDPKNPDIAKGVVPTAGATAGAAAMQDNEEQM